MKKSITNGSKWAVVLCVCAILLIIAVLIFVIIKQEQHADDSGDSYDQNIKILNESHPVKIILYGESLYFRSEVKYISVDHLSNDIFSTNENEFERVVLVINDLNGTVTLSDDDLATISRAVNNGDIDLYYLGKNNRDKLINSNIPGGNAIIEGDLSLVRAFANNKMKNFIGFWTESDAAQANEEALGFCIIDNIVSCIKSNN